MKNVFNNVNNGQKTDYLVKVLVTNCLKIS